MFCTGTLLAYTFFPPYWLAPIIPAQSESIIVPKISSVETSKPKETKPTVSHIQDIGITVQDKKDYLKAMFEKYGIADQIPIAIATIQCESGFQSDPKHNNSCRGIAQFQPFTWKYVTEKGWCSGDYMDPKSQLNCMAILWKMGYQSWWECYGMVQ